MKLSRLLAVFLLVAFSLSGQQIEVSFPRLNRWYVSDNMAYFNDALPRDTVLVYGTLDNAMGDTKKISGQFKITIDKRWAPAELTQQETVLHEMCHIETWDEVDEHGPKWHSCIQRLKIAGAFDDLL